MTRREFVSMLWTLPLPSVVWMADPARTFHVVDIPDFATCRDTHVETIGFVSFVKKEDDGDLHIRLIPHWDAYGDHTGEPFIVCEIIPELPVRLRRRPKVGDTLKVRGIRRFDDAHGWPEIHPVTAAKILISVTAW